MKTRKRRQDPDAEYNFWQPATDMMSALVFVLVLVIALLGLYLLSDYTGYEEPSSSSEEAASSGWNNSDPSGASRKQVCALSCTVRIRPI